MLLSPSPPSCLPSTPHTVAPPPSCSEGLDGGGGTEAAPTEGYPPTPSLTSPHCSEGPDGGGGTEAAPTEGYPPTHTHTVSPHCSEGPDGGGGTEAAPTEGYPPTHTHTVSPHCSEGPDGGGGTEAAPTEAHLMLLEDAIRDAVRMRRTVYEGSKDFLMKLFKWVY